MSKLMELGELISGLTVPLIQAPMAGVQGSALAIAVCNAGAVGSLPCAMLDVKKLKAELETITAATSNPFNVNFFCHAEPEFDLKKEQQWRSALAPWFKQYDIDPDGIPQGGGRQPFNHQTAAVVEHYKPAIVSFHFGLPEPDLLARVKSSGSIILSSATTVDEARWLADNGADGIIAQGLEAGGHRGMFLSDDLALQMSTSTLLPMIADAVDIPVIAAGGITDSAGISAALAAGADAVQLGTMFLLCDEAGTSALHKDAIKNSDSSQRVLTNIFTGRPARGIINKAIKELGPTSQVVQSFPLAATAITEIRKKAEAQGSGDFTPLWCGQNSAGCKEVSAQELIAELTISLLAVK